MWHAGQVIAGLKIDHGSTASHSGVPKRWRLVDRLGEQIIRDLLRDSRAGTTQQRLAERYAISVSSVRRLLRRP
jgi:DNA-binding GntR family transcriptional regulator